MSWAEIKSALNSSVGTSNHKPINELIEEEGYRSIYNNALTLKECQLDSIAPMQFFRYKGYDSTSSYLDLVDESSKILFLENGFKKIRENFCSGNHNVISAHLPPSIVEIGYEAFADCGFLENVNIPSGVKRIGQHAFAYVPIKSLMLGNKIEVVSDAAFSYNNKITTAVIDATASNSLSLGSNIFAFCSYLERVYIFARPGAEISISPYAFSNCDNLVDIYVSWGYGEVAGAPWGGSGDVTMHHNVKEVG